MVVAEGAVDVTAEPEVSLWDLAPLDILVREAGGRFTALDGTPFAGDPRQVLRRNLDLCLTWVAGGQEPLLSICNTRTG